MMCMSRKQYILGGAALGAFMIMLSTGLILLQPGIFTGGEGSVRSLLVINFAFGLPICTVFGGVLGWIWSRYFTDSRTER